MHASFVMRTSCSLKSAKVKGQGHSRNVYFFVHANKILALSLATYRSFRLREVQVFLVKLVSKEAQNSNIVAAMLNSTQKPCRPRFRIVIPSER